MRAIKGWNVERSTVIRLIKHWTRKNTQYAFSIAPTSSIYANVWYVSYSMEPLERERKQCNIWYMFGSVTNFLTFVLLLRYVFVVCKMCVRVSDFNSKHQTIAMLIECDKRTIHTFVLSSNGSQKKIVTKKAKPKWDDRKRYFECTLFIWRDFFCCYLMCTMAYVVVTWSDSIQ